eukprot:scaffold2930_cov244-Pinguiococcus_pyrenoidosus.AAC.12
MNFKKRSHPLGTPFRATRVHLSHLPPLRSSAPNAPHLAATSALRILLTVGALKSRMASFGRLSFLRALGAPSAIVGAATASVTPEALVLLLAPLHQRWVATGNGRAAVRPRSSWSTSSHPTGRPRWRAGSATTCPASTSGGWWWATWRRLRTSSARAMAS